MKLYRLLPLLIPLAFFVAAAILVTCNGCTPKSLPHRQLGELSAWGQGHNPGRDNCPPGTVAFYVEDLFLECYR